LPSSGFREFKVKDGEAVEMGVAGTVILAPTSSSYPARFTAPYVMETANKMGASVSALFIKTYQSDPAEGQKALRIYNEVAKKYDVDIKLLYKEGDILENILLAVEQENASIVIMGSKEESMFGSLTKRSISQELLVHLHIPTMIIPMNRETMSRRSPPMEIDYENGDVELDSIKNLENMGEPDFRNN
jgi:K+-sensing histidine kinase KdpD